MTTMCPHGGLAHDGLCVLDAGHPEVTCPGCGFTGCPCGTCWRAHTEDRGCTVTREAVEAHVHEAVAAAHKLTPPRG